METDEAALWKALEEICATRLEPDAEAVDNAGQVPRDNLMALADAGLVAITTPVEYGGIAVSAAFRNEYHERMCAACGTTWFVLTQHLGSCGQFASSENPVLRERHLRDMAAGRFWVGVGFGHLRRPQPMLRATPVAGGWILDGAAPWVTGWPILSGVIFGAHLPDGRHIYLYAAVDAPGLTASRPLPLCAMQATETVEVRCEKVFVPEEHWLRYSSREELARGDLYNAAMTTAPMLGVATGSLGTLRATAARRPIEAIVRAADALEAEIDACRAECRDCMAHAEPTEEYKARSLAARAWAIDLGVRAGHMAVAAASGGANNRTHPAQRRLREAIFYTVYQQTVDIMEATLARLVR